jgi:hypothetical protein
MGVTPTKLFVDTNVLLHYKPLREIDWLGLVKEHGLAVDAVQVVVAAIVVREVDEQKFSHPRRTVRERAQRITGELEAAYMASERGQPLLLRNQVPLVVQIRDSEDAFATHGLRRNVADDALVAAILGYSTAVTALVSADAGARMTALRCDIPVISPMVADRLPSEEDELAKELRQLRQENAVLKNKEPRLALRFSPQPGQPDSRLVVTIPPMPAKPEAAWREALDRAAALVPPYRAPAAATAPQAPDSSLRAAFWRKMRAEKIDASGLAGSLSGIDARDIERYEQDRVRYLGAYEAGLRDSFDRWVEFRRSFLVSFDLENVGTVPAEEIDVWFHIPDGPEVDSAHAFALAHPYDADAIDPPIMDPPPPPTPPRTVLEVMMARTGALGAFYTGPSFDFGPGRNDGMRISRTNSFECEQSVHRLKHGQQCSLDAMRLWFPVSVEPRGFAIRWRVSAANLALPAEGTLHVQVTNSG